MVITATYPKDMYEGRMEISINTQEGIKRVSFGTGESEDMNLARDLNGAYNIESMLLMAYRAGQSGEKSEVIYEEDEDN